MPYNPQDIDWMLHHSHSQRSSLEQERKQLFAQQKTISNRIRDLAPKTRPRPKAATSLDGDPGADVEAADAAHALGPSEIIADLQREAREIKQRLSQVETDLDQVYERSKRIRLSWSNSSHPDTPEGPEENAIVVSVKDPRASLPSCFDLMKESWNRSVLTVRDFGSSPEPDPSKDHLAVATQLKGGTIDLAAGALTTARSWPFLFGTITSLEHALSQYALATVIKHGFIPVSTPDVVRSEFAERCGFQPRDEKARQTYFLESGSESNQDQLCLVATAEIALAALLTNRLFHHASIWRSPPSLGISSYASHPVFHNQPLPIKLVALGHAFRTEAGARGADSRGLYRVHQFTKAEMFVVTGSDGGESDKALEELREIQEEVLSGLGLAYRVLDMPTEELGASAYRKYDIEAWMPGRGAWGEVSSASNCTDYQAQRLKITYRDASYRGDQKSKYVHTLNATAAAIPRLIVAILENYGVKDGKLMVPDTLKPYWIGGANDPGVEWVSMPKEPQSALGKAVAKVRSMAEKNGTDPASMVASFMILHELTAIVPIVLIFYLLGALGAGEAVCEWLKREQESTSQSGDAKEGVIASTIRGWMQEGILRAERVGRKYGLFGFEKKDAGAGEANKEAVKGSIDSTKLAGSFANAVAAYAIVKALLPVRIGASIALAGPFSRMMIEPLKRLVRKTVARPGAKVTA